MRVHTSTRFAAMAALVGALACAGNPEPDTDEAAAARDTTTSDTLGQNQPGYRGMERDTTIAPPDSQPSDSFLQNQGTGTPQDTSGYSGAERVDTTARAQEGQQMDAGDTTSMTRDSSWNEAGDTTGYNPTQQPGDSISR